MEQQAANTNDPQQAPTRKRPLRTRAHSAQPATVSGRGSSGPSPSSFRGAAFCAWASFACSSGRGVGSCSTIQHRQSRARLPHRASLRIGGLRGQRTRAHRKCTGWWIPRPQARYTAVYLHGADGNLGDTVDALTRCTAPGVSVLAFDYRGYGQSKFVRPSEAHWRQDADSAIQYLTQTRHIPANSLVLIGRGLGANLALEVAAAHPELAGVVMDDPLPAPEDAIFADPRSMLVPAHLLVRDRWNARPSAESLEYRLCGFIGRPCPDRRTENTGGLPPGERP